REIRVWLKLTHINVLPLFGTTMGFGLYPAMVCPWLEDGPLTSYLERRNDSLPTVERLVLVGDVAAGLQYLHSQTVVHGDLSGSNVLIHGNGRACISDFGMSTLLTELGGSTFATSLHAGPAGGTLRWGAPELLDLEVFEDEENPPKVVPTPQSDIYSFGAIMLQVLTGKVPYHYFSREAQVLHAISRGEIPKRPNKALVTDDQWTFIERCWFSVDARPSDDEIVEFTRNELVQYVLPQV
ncbi:kinase-like protein, partial [Paxillus ammoniavirescens]